ncbi:MAG: hypothetical protein R3C68_16155 [Myxococcota bacterium]
MSEIESTSSAAEMMKYLLERPRGRPQADDVSAETAVEMACATRDTIDDAEAQVLFAFGTDSMLSRYTRTYILNALNNPSCASIKLGDKQ